jgi:hypothetical protein
MEAEHPMPYERFDADHLLTAALVTGLVGLGLVWVPTPIAVPVLVVVAFLSGRRRGNGFHPAGAEAMGSASETHDLGLAR